MTYAKRDHGSKWKFSNIIMNNKLLKTSLNKRLNDEVNWKLNSKYDTLLVVGLSAWKMYLMFAEKICIVSAFKKLLTIEGVKRSCIYFTS